MPKIGMNIEEIEERQACPVDTYTLRITKAEITANSKGDGRVVAVQMMPLEQPTYRIFKSWSLKPNVLSSSDPLFSIRKFIKDFLKVDSVLDEDWDTDEIVRLEFMGKVEHEDYQGRPRAKLGRILAGS